MDRDQLIDRMHRESVANAPVAELDNLLQIIAATTHQLEDIWDGDHGSKKYLSMLQASVERAASITAQLVSHAAAIDNQHPPLISIPRSTEETEISSDGASRILVVDDDDAALLLFEQFLSVPGYEVVTAQSGFECLDRLSRRAADFDLVILDYKMPFMDGEETFRRIRAVQPEMKILLITAFIEQEPLDEMLASGLTAFMRKPLAPDDLLACVGRLLSPSSAPVGNGIAAAL